MGRLFCWGEWGGAGTQLLVAQAITGFRGAGAGSRRGCLRKHTASWEISACAETCRRSWTHMLAASGLNVPSSSRRWQRSWITAPWHSAVWLINGRKWLTMKPTLVCKWERLGCRTLSSRGFVLHVNFFCVCMCVPSSTLQVSLPVLNDFSVYFH